MQAGGLGLLIAAAAPVSATNANTSDAGNGAGDNAAPASSFAQLVSDGGAQTQSQAGQRQGNLAGDWSSELPPRTLLAQDCPVDWVLPNIGATELLKQAITPQEATALLAQLAQSQQEHPPQTPAETQLATDLKTALTAIEQGTEPQKISDVFSQLPSIVAAPQGGRAPLLYKALDWMQAAYSKLQTAKIAAVHAAETAMQDADAAPSSADVSASSLLQSLQATHFRSDAASGQPIEDTASDPSDAEKAAQDAALALAGTASAQGPAWVSAIGVNDNAPLNQRIPSLSVSESKANALPEVDLPQLGAEESLQETPAKLPVASSDSFMLASEASLKDASASRVDTLLQDGNLENPSRMDMIENPSGVLSPHATQVRHGATGVHTAHAVLQTGHILNHAPVTDQVQVAITRSAESGGGDSLTIQLDPVELGRVEVKMHTAADGQTHVSFLVDKAETLDALARDARGLERSLQEAGIKADAGGMQFNLRQQPQSQASFGQGGFGQPNQQQADLEEEGTTSSTAPVSAASLTRHYTLNLRDGVDIQA